MIKKKTPEGTVKVRACNLELLTKRKFAQYINLLLWSPRVWRGLCAPRQQGQSERNHSQVVNCGLTGEHESWSNLEKDNL